MRLKLWGWGCLFVVFGIGTFLVLLHSTVTDVDRFVYEALAKKTKELKSSDVLERHPSEQVRKVVEKDLWTGEGRLHFHVQSEASNLLLAQRAQETSLREKMDHVVYTSQEPSMTLSAAHGLYEYPSLQMSADDIDCQHQMGKLRAGSALLEGMEGQVLTLHDHVLFTPSLDCANASISSNEAVCHWDTSTIEFMKEVHVNMERLQEHLVAKGDHALYGEGILTLYPESGDAKCSVLRDMDVLQARTITFDLVSEQIVCHEATGQLQSIHDKESFIVAENIVYDLRMQTLTLTASAGEHVLFWQDGCSLSASEIEITQEKKVLGKGDVHCTFTVEEQNIIEQLISKYL
jgi:hypothetical protein